MIRRLWLRLVYLWASWRCPHARWRPAKFNGSGAKVCFHCDRLVVLSDEEFYAEFGERFTALKAVQE